jgi:hypothetical protein
MKRRPPPRRRNTTAKALRSPALRQRVIPGKRRDWMEEARKSLSGRE